MKLSVSVSQSKITDGCEMTENRQICISGTLGIGDVVTNSLEQLLGEHSWLVEGKKWWWKEKMVRSEDGGEKWWQLATTALVYISMLEIFLTIVVEIFLTVVFEIFRPL